MARNPNDDRSDSLNPNNPAYWHSHDDGGDCDQPAPIEQRRTSPVAVCAPIPNEPDLLHFDARISDTVWDGIRKKYSIFSEILGGKPK